MPAVVSKLEEISKRVSAPAAAAAASAAEAKAPETAEELDARLDGLVRRQTVMLFMKGNATTPRCGFSREMVALLNKNQIKFDSFDILTDNAVRVRLCRRAPPGPCPPTSDALPPHVAYAPCLSPYLPPPPLRPSQEGLKKKFNWMTYPQLYVNGKLIGGLDVVKGMAEEVRGPPALAGDDPASLAEDSALLRFPSAAHVSSPSPPFFLLHPRTSSRTRFPRANSSPKTDSPMHKPSQRSRARAYDMTELCSRIVNTHSAISDTWPALCHVYSVLCPQSPSPLAAYFAALRMAVSQTLFSFCCCAVALDCSTVSSFFRSPVSGPSGWCRPRLSVVMASSRSFSSACGARRGGKERATGRVTRESRFEREASKRAIHCARGPGGASAGAGARAPVLTWASAFR